LEAKKGGLVKGEKKTDQVSTEIDEFAIFFLYILAFHLADLILDPTALK